MKKCLVLTLSLAICAVGLASAAEEEREGLSSVSLKETLIFSAPGGSAVNVSAGSYVLEITDAGHLTLAPVEGGDAVVVKAKTGKHDEAVNEAVALLIAADDGPAHHLVLLLPDGELAEAVGSPSGVAYRGVRRLPSRQLRTATVNKLGQRKGATAAELSPADAAAAEAMAAALAAAAEEEAAAEALAREAAKLQVLDSE